LASDGVEQGIGNDALLSRRAILRRFPLLH
jgi:hypothetical protein